MCAPTMPSSQMNKSVMRPNSNGGSLFGLVTRYATAKRAGRRDEARQIRSQAKTMSMSPMSIKRRRPPENLGSSGTGVNFNN